MVDHTSHLIATELAAWEPCVCKMIEALPYSIGGVGICLITRFPVSRSTATVELVAVLFVILLDHTGILRCFTRRTRFPSAEMVRFDDARS
ncbi:Os01g0890050 [Oryza sativa Japonica Group]|uniref:Os01g0890050 protein n=1 Tax=Oryza sativa subsp. japonica TaxID=39947 RepID=A0A0N7KE77_ORYSJ|nr:hypothetical protein EE612_007295 [Oryza sativa]BAS75649.1 Os01g0890050 [Oryza sativa Japonica Group]